jgi:hypothetical protein
MGQLVVYATIDAMLTHDDLSKTKTFHEMVVGAGTEIDNDGHSYNVLLWASAAPGTDKWRRISRVGMVFDTSALPDTCTITGATLKTTCWSKSDGLVCTPNVCLYSFSPASEAALAITDYALFGAVALSNAVAYADWPTDKSQATFTLNATGLALISKTGNTCLGLRNASYDVADTPPTWASNTSSSCNLYGRNGESDPHVPAQGPTLTIDYTDTPVASSNKGTYSARTTAQRGGL